jgi:hypothetical protein
VKEVDRERRRRGEKQGARAIEVNDWVGGWVGGLVGGG